MATTSGLTVAICSATDAVLLRCSGEIDLCNVHLLAEPLREHLTHVTRELAVDLSGVTYLDSAAIKELLRAAVVLGRRGKRLRVQATPHQQKLLGVTQLGTEAACHQAQLRRGTCPNCVTPSYWF